MASTNSITKNVNDTRVTQEINYLVFDFFKNLSIYKEYLKQSVARDLRKRYRRSFLGYIWSMLQPLLMMCILSLVFAKIMNQNIKEYAIFLFTGMLPWRYFLSTVTECLNSVRANAKIFEQIPVPKYIFPVSIALSNLADLLFSLVPLLLLMLVLGAPIKASILFLPFILLTLFFVSVGVGLLLAVSNIFFEDTQHLSGVFFQALYFLSPILYKPDLLHPSLAKSMAVINPMFQIIQNMRAIFVQGHLPGLLSYSWAFIYSLLLLAFGLIIFRKSENKFLYFL